MTRKTEDRLLFWAHMLIAAMLVAPILCAPVMQGN
jgi:hypothetical protein